jgi:hypothetical protein
MEDAKYAVAAFFDGTVSGESKRTTILNVVEAISEAEAVGDMFIDIKKTYTNVKSLTILAKEIEKVLK